MSLKVGQKVIITKLSKRQFAIEFNKLSKMNSYYVYTKKRYEGYYDHYKEHTINT